MIGLVAVFLSEFSFPIDEDAYQSPAKRLISLALEMFF